MAGDTLNITCNFLYCNHQVHRDFLIILYINEMGGACSAYGGEERRVRGFDGETWEKETTGETQA
jgi:hypothetical protein